MNQKRTNIAQTLNHWLRRRKKDLLITLRYTRVYFLPTLIYQNDVLRRLDTYILIFQQASIEANLERKRQERQKLYTESSDADSDTASSEASTKDIEVSTSDKYNINDKIYDKLFENTRICEIDDQVLVKMKDEESKCKDPESDEMEDKKLIDMLMTLPKRNSKPIISSAINVTSYVDLSTPNGTHKKRTGKG